MAKFNVKPVRTDDSTPARNTDGARRSLPKSIISGEKADQFVSGALYSTSPVMEYMPDKTQQYPWLGEIGEDERTSFYFKLSKKLALKLDFVCKQTKLKKRAVLEEALEKYFADYMKKHDIPNE